MKITLKELASIVGGELEGNGQHAVMGVRNLEEATENDVTFLQSAKLEHLLAASKAGCVFLAPEYRQKAGSKGNFIYVKNPQLAFAKVLEMIEKETQVKRPPGYHPSAVISPLARLGKDVHLGPMTVIEKGAVIGNRSKIDAQSYVGQNARIGADCLIYPQVVIRENVSIGDRVILHSGVVIGSDGYGYAQTESGHFKIPQIGRVTIENDVEIGANTTVDRATIGETVIGEGTKIDNLVQIAHNVKIGKRCLIVAQVGIAGSSELGDGVVLAGQVGVADHIKIGSGAVVGAQSGVMQAVPERAIHFGSPSRPHIEAMRILALLGRLPELSDKVKKLAKALEKQPAQEQQNG